MWCTTRFHFGPITSILYVNDITTTLNVLDFILFADNTTFLYSHENIENQIDTVNTELKEVSNWFRTNTLSQKPSRDIRQVMTVSDQ